MSRFLQLHFLTAYPPSNLNRDDLGRPKTALVGGANRLRVSSQSLKRAWRTSETFETTVSGHVGVRTKGMGVHIYDSLVAQGVAEKKARDWARSIAGVFGKLKKDDGSHEGLEIEQLAHFSPEERQAIDDLIQVLAGRGSEPSEEEKALLRKAHTATDIALFGRMLADKPEHNVEAAAQVAHAITVHKAAVEDDFFTAVDDLNLGREDKGSAHMGEIEFGAGLFYLYVCIDRELLTKNLNGDAALANKAIEGLVRAAATISPTGKQASFASRAYASYILAEKGEQQPRSLSVAFLKPVTGSDMLTTAIQYLEGTKDRMDKAYGDCADARYPFNVEAGEGTLEGLVQFATE